jgi:hypothetical protein
MKRGYTVSWPDHAINELEQTIDYLAERGTDRELKIVASQLEQTLKLS